MRDEDKSKEQLIVEIAELRRCKDELAASEAESKRFQKELSLLQMIILAVNEAEDMNAAFFAVLHKICRITGWVYGEVWRPSSDGTLLERSPLWYSTSDSLDRFGTVSESFTFAHGMGLPGRVWSSRRPIWIKDVTKDENYLRTPIAREAGLKTGLGVPILAMGEVVAVMVFYLFEERDEDERFVELVSAVSAQLGSVIRHKQAEEELKISEEHYRSLIESSQDCICDISLDGKFRSMNAAGCAINELDRPEELLGKICTESIVENREEAEEAVKRAARGETVTVLYKSVSKTGKGIWWDSKVTPVMGTDGNVTSILRISRDITERKKAEEYRSQLIAILEATSDFVATADMEGNVLYFNNAARKMLGIGDDEDISKIRIPYTHPDWANAVVLGQGIPTAIREGIWSGETAFLNGEGREIPASQVIIAHKSLNGEVKILSTIARDITEIQKREEELLSLKKAVDTMQIGITLADLEGNILFVNPAEAAMHGYEVKELIGRNVRVYAPSERWNKIALKDMKEIERAVKRESVNIRKDGSRFPVQLFSDAVIDSTGHIVGIVTSCEDITERKRLEEELLKVSKLESVSTLSGGIAHDFNNILTIILGKISLAKMLLNPHDETFGILGDAEKGCKRARDLTTQLLTFSKGGAPIKNAVYIPELIKESADLVLTGSNVRCVYSLPAGLRPVEVDEGQMSQVMNNLLINAVQAMPDGGVINISAENVVVWPKDALPLKDGEYVKISVRDHGVGIQKEYLQRIFDPFFTTKQKGSGLGLATSYSIVRKHDGYITVESELGAGTTFHLYLPAAAKEIDAKIVSEDRPVAGAGRVLIMDDEEVLRDSTGDLLKHLGYEVETAGDGLEAIQKYKKAKDSGLPFDVVIMDLTIPGGMGGKEAIKKLLEVDPDIKAIVSSGYSNDTIMADFRPYGFKGVVAKPYKIEELSDMVDRVMRGD